MNQDVLLAVKGGSFRVLSSSTWVCVLLGSKPGRHTELSKDRERYSLSRKSWSLKSLWWYALVTTSTWPGVWREKDGQLGRLSCRRKTSVVQIFLAFFSAIFQGFPPLLQPHKCSESQIIFATSAASL